MQTITSQHHIDSSIVAAKVEAGDFEVMVSPAFEIDGEAFRVVLDGHHSLAAAIETGTEPVYVEATATDHDTIALLEAGDIEGFLAANWMDGEYINALTGEAIW